MSLTNIVGVRDAIRAVCAAVDAGTVDVEDPDFERDALRLAELAHIVGGSLLADEIHQLAARTRNGRAELAKKAQ